MKGYGIRSFFGKPTILRIKEVIDAGHHLKSQPTDISSVRVGADVTDVAYSSKQTEEVMNDEL